MIFMLWLECISYYDNYTKTFLTLYQDARDKENTNIANAISLKTKRKKISCTTATTNSLNKTTKVSY